MNSSEIINSVCSALKSALSEVAVITEFPDKAQHTPLSSPVITVGIDGVTVKSESADMPYVKPNNAFATLNVGITLCCPKTYSGQRCHELLDSAVISLSKVTAVYNVIGISFGALKYSSSLAALVVEGRVTIGVSKIF